MHVLDAIRALDKIAHAIEVPYPHWIGGDDADQGPSYCRECANKKVESGEAEYVDGGWQQESDGCCHCDTCGMLLDYVLTDYGVAEEMEHYSAATIAGPISPEEAYHLSRLLDQYLHHPEVLAVLPAIMEALAAAPAQGGSADDSRDD